MISGEFVDSYAMGRAAVAVGSDGSVALVLPTGVLRFPASTFDDGADTFESTPPPSVSAIAGLGSAYLIIGNPSPDAADEALGRRLEALGFSIVYAQDRFAELATAEQVSLVVIAASAHGARVSPAFRDLGVPLLSLDPFALVRLGLTSDRSRAHGQASGTAFVVVRPDHPLSGGGHGTYRITGRKQSLPWAVPNGAAVTVAVADTGQPVIFGYERQALTPGGVAPERRAALLLPGGHAGFQAAAWAFFDSAVRWAVGSDEAASTSLANVATSSPGTNESGAEGLTGGSGTILLVVGNLSLSAGESVYKSRMEAMGFDVKVQKDSDTLSSDHQGKKLVFVSQTCSGVWVENLFVSVATPVLVQQAAIVCWRPSGSAGI